MDKNSSLEEFLKFKTRRTKRIISSFNSADIAELFEEESHRRPAQGSRKAGIDQQEE